jgi:DNA processing protein
MALGIGTGRGAPVPEMDPYAPERDAWTVLASVDGLGPIGFAALLATHGSAQDVLAVAARPGGTEELAGTPNTDLGRRARPIHDEVAAAIADATQRASTILTRLRALDVRVVTVEEPSYPSRLAGIAMPPHVLYLRGPLATLSHGRAVAVVGTRRATASGRAVAARIATELAVNDATVVSGLAFGIDGAAHEATLRAGGVTVAVIGGGHATLGPVAHARLADAILATGGSIVSELAPDVEPSKGTFPRRNRIISGLTDATVVVEAPARSGALITASWALEQGRGCFIVPGPLDSRASAGCLAFLREFADAAHIVAGLPQLMADLGFGAAIEDSPDALAGAAQDALGRTEARVARGLMDGHATVDELVAVLDLPVATVLAALTLLERRGLANGVFGRYRPAGPLLGEQTALWERVKDDRHAREVRARRASEGTGRHLTQVPVAQRPEAVLP